MRKIKAFVISLTILVAAFVTFLGIKVNATTPADNNAELTLTLEQQEHTNSSSKVDMIRYICTLGNVTNLSDIDDLKINFYRYKYGNKAYKASSSISKVYESVTGESTKTKKDYTYYAVYTLTDLDADAYQDWTITVSFSACGKTSNEISYTINDSGDTFIKSMDASAVPALESVGVKYYNVGSETSEDVYKILADNGVNYIRVRIWNDPYDADGNGYGGGNCDLNNAIAIGKRANKYGMKILADFQYSDFWADPGKQILPKAWASYTTEEIKSAVYSFTKESLTTMKKANIDIGMVQVGNETNDSMCGIMGEEGTMETVCSFMAQGSKAVREIYPEALVALHFANPSNASEYYWYASELNKAGVDYDVFGTSYYPYWHGTQSNLTTVLTTIATSYNKKVMILETSYANCEMENDSANSDGYGNTVYTKASTIEENGDLADVSQPYTVAGQKQQVEDLMDLIAAIKTDTNQYGIGVSYWEGTWISTAKYASALELTKEEMWDQYGTGWAATYANDYYLNFANNHSAWLEKTGKTTSDFTISSAGGCVIENEAFFDEDGHAFASIAAFKHEVSSTTNVTKPLTKTLTNGDFESGTAGWTIDLTGTNAGYSNPNYLAKGSYDLCIYDNSEAYTADVYQEIALSPGNYTLDVYFAIKTWDGAKYTATLYVSDQPFGTDSDVNYSSIIEVKNSETMEAIGLNFTVSSSNYIYVGVYIEGQAWMTAYIDDFVITKIED